MSMVEMCQWLQDTAIGTSIRESTWVFPIIEGTHLLGIAASVGTLLMMDLRLAGLLFTRQPVSKVSKAVMPVSLAGFSVMFITGSLLFWCQAVKAWGSVFFKIKLALLLLAAINAITFELAVRPSSAGWDNDPVPPLRARIAGFAALAIWAGVICAGRTMAYNF